MLRVNSRDDPCHRHALIHIGKAQLALGREAEAKHYFAELLRSPYVSDKEKKEVDTALVFHAAVSRYNAAKYEEAASLFEDLLENQQEGESEHVETLYWLGHSFFGEQRL